jgi:hypothetical protein
MTMQMSGCQISLIVVMASWVHTPVFNRGMAAEETK